MSGNKPLPNPNAALRGDELIWSYVGTKINPEEQTYHVIKWLTHWGRVKHICISNLTIIGSDDGLLPHRRQAIIWTNAGILLIGPLGTNFSENLIEILTFSITKMLLKVSSAKWRPFCLCLNVLNLWPWITACSFVICVIDMAIHLPHDSSERVYSRGKTMANWNSLIFVIWKHTCHSWNLSVLFIS